MSILTGKRGWEGLWGRIGLSRFVEKSWGSREIAENWVNRKVHRNAEDTLVRGEEFSTLPVLADFHLENEGNFQKSKILPWWLIDHQPFRAVVKLHRHPPSTLPNSSAEVPRCSALPGLKDDYQVSRFSSFYLSLERQAVNLAREKNRKKFRKKVYRGEKKVSVRKGREFVLSSRPKGGVDCWVSDQSQSRHQKKKREIIAWSARL